MTVLENIDGPSDLKRLTSGELIRLCAEIREFIVDKVKVTGGHLGSNLGAVELTVAIHLSFESPKDVVLFDTGHQAYVHKILTGRRDMFDTLRQEGGLSGYPSRSESEHDWIENSHASTALSYAHGLACAMNLGRGPLVGTSDAQVASDPTRYVVAVVGDGALTGGLAYEALNNIGHGNKKVIIIWNDNGRSYAPTISRLSSSITKIRLNPTYIQARGRIRQILSEFPRVGSIASSGIVGLTTALREAIEPRVFFEALGVRYTGPIDGHDISAMGYALAGAKEWDGPIVVHVMTHKGHGYGPAEQDEVQCLHDLKVAPLIAIKNRESFTDAFSEKLIEIASHRSEIVAITAAMPGPTGLLKFEANFPERFFDVGIAEAHAVTSAAGMAMGGLRPVVAIYSTFIARAFDQVNLDVSLHNLPVVFILDRAGITGDDGPSHHGLLDMVEMLAIPNLTIFAPSGTDALRSALEASLNLSGPAVIRFPKTTGVTTLDGLLPPLDPFAAHKLRGGNGSIAIVGVGKMAEFALEAANLLEDQGLDVTAWDPRIIKPLCSKMMRELTSMTHVFVVEDGFVPGGVGSHLSYQLNQSQLVDPTEVVQLGVPIGFIKQGKPNDILARLGLDGIGIAKSVMAHLNHNQIA
ncbi:1-deoxy-D-xylulose-5-phosphate synthase [Acidithrix ferrooxidans]|uniref:1-deoxy-D-xylulose-5-phosphate synthase n=2 Tax=root TaxID=1 RepID=A0A0D8HGY7_9ACTN|nr:1-deoxy-D-xylulose-5-phosphate synthase [Acidithrix ferrooxidans]KJF17037.1 1-deoxy-D-xylulose-5-phosphate synthase [Acidithrix ferrooxidans]